MPGHRASHSRCFGVPRKMIPSSSSLGHMRSDEVAGRRDRAGGQRSLSTSHRHRRGGGRGSDHPDERGTRHRPAHDFESERGLIGTPTLASAPQSRPYPIRVPYFVRQSICDAATQAISEPEYFHNRRHFSINPSSSLLVTQIKYIARPFRRNGCSLKG